jgi:CDP-diacylglycerol--serine O-phosphatidyltransferase
MSVIYASQEEFMLSAAFILIASLFDMVDGLMARLINATSEFGVELDSLSDAVSFGIAPSFLLYQIHFYQFGELGIFISALPALLGVVRLARFNVQIESFDDKKYFIGFPIPANALFIVSYVIYYHLTDLIGTEYQSILIWIVALSGSLAMVSLIKFKNIPRPSKKYVKENTTYTIVFLIFLFACIVSRGKLVFPVLLFYLLVFSVIWLINWFKKHREPEDEIDDFEINEI